MYTGRYLKHIEKPALVRGCNGQRGHAEEHGLCWKCALCFPVASMHDVQEMGREIDSLKLFSEDVSRQQLQPLQPKVSYKAHLAARLMRSFL